LVWPTDFLSRLMLRCTRSIVHCIIVRCNIFHSFFCAPHIIRNLLIYFNYYVAWDDGWAYPAESAKATGLVKVHKLKKYPNRRLYDSTASKYVTLKDVRKLISDGESIVVEDSNDGSDLTRSVLMQILSEQEAEGREPILTNRAIEMIIRLYSVRMGRVLSRYVEQSLLTFFNNQDRFRTRMRELNDMNPLAMMRNMMESSWGTRPSRSKRDESKPPEPDDS